MPTSDKSRGAEPHPFADAERRLARRFLLGELQAEAEGVRRYRARRHETGAHLDVHLMPLSVDDIEGNRAFRDGVGSARALRHAAVQTLVEAGRLDDHHVYALVGLRGSHDLDRLLERGPLPVPRAIQVLFEVAGALEILHRRGGAYGHLGVGHLSLTPRGGDATDVRLLPASWLAAPAFTGGPAPLPPEGREAGAAGDLWHLGTLGQQLLSGASVPASLEQLLHDLVSPDPARRPRSVVEVAVLLRDQGDAHAEPPAIAPPMMVFTPIPTRGRNTPIPTQVGDAVAFDVIRDTPPPRRPSSVQPAARRPRHGNTPKPRGTPARVSPAAAQPEPIPTPVPRYQTEQRPPARHDPTRRDSFEEDVTTEVTIVPRLETRIAGGPTRMGPATFGLLVAVTVLAGAALVPLLMQLLG